MHRSIAPTLIEESSVLVKRCEVVDVGLGAEPIEVTDFEIGPLITYISKKFPTIPVRLPCGNGYKSLHRHRSRNP